MDGIWGLFADYPWLLPLLAVGSAIWIAAVIIIFRSKKFLRKWLWVLLSFFTFSWSWQTDSNTSISVGFPIGALYVLGFWLFGPWPTPQQLAQENARREERERRNRAEISRPDTGRRLVALRTGYGLAVLGALSLAALAGSGAITNAMFAAAHAGPNMRPILPPGFGLMTGAGFAVIAMLFVLLALRPYWWGKLICIWAGLSWTGFGAVGFLIMPGSPAVSGIALASGIAVLLAALIHQIADPRFSGPYLRSA